jgi:hypothetical protein
MVSLVPPGPPIGSHIGAEYCIDLVLDRLQIPELGNRRQRQLEPRVDEGQTGEHQVLQATQFAGSRVAATSLVFHNSGQVKKIDDSRLKDFFLDNFVERCL